MCVCVFFILIYFLLIFEIYIYILLFDCRGGLRFFFLFFRNFKSKMTVGRTYTYKKLWVGDLIQKVTGDFVISVSSSDGKHQH